MSDSKTNRSETATPRKNGHAPLPETDELELLTPNDVATLFKVPVTWVRSATRARAKNPLPHFKVGVYVRFHEDDVREWLKTRKVYKPQPAKARKH